MSGLDMYVAGNITSGRYFEKDIRIEGLGNFYLIADAVENDPLIHLVAKDEGSSSYHQKTIYGEVDINELEEKQLEAVQKEIKTFKKESGISFSIP